MHQVSPIRNFDRESLPAIQPISPAEVEWTTGKGREGICPENCPKP